MDKNARYVRQSLNDASNLNFITVEGKPIRVAHRDLGIFAGTWANMGDISTCCGKYRDTRFGVVEGKNGDEKSYLFYNGNPTKVMPTAGLATYRGHFLITGSSAAFEEEDYRYGLVNLNADFAAKTVKGTLNTEANAVAPVNVAAKIEGNGFNGTARSASFATQANVEGKFYGNNAKELGGLFRDQGNTWGGAFGASQ